MDQAAKFEEVTIALPAPLGGVESLSAVVGIPEWWPTGARVAVAIAHDSDADLNDPLVEAIHRDLAYRKYLTVRFNFPFAEAGRVGQEDEIEILELGYRAALSILGRDPGAAPSHLFLGGIGSGARVAALLATQRLQIDGVFLLGYPLHPANRPQDIQADHLYRIIAPMLFVQGTLDPTCSLPVLQKSLRRVGAPTTLKVIEGADRRLEVVPPPIQSEEGEIPSKSIVAQVIAEWMEKVLATG